MHALLPSIIYIGKVECSQVPYRVCQACSSLLLTCLSLHTYMPCLHSYMSCLHSYMPCLHSYMPCLHLALKISYVWGLDMVKLSLFEKAASIRSICVHLLYGQIMLCAWGTLFSSLAHTHICAVLMSASVSPDSGPLQVQTSLLKADSLHISTPTCSSHHSCLTHVYRCQLSAWISTANASAR